MYELGLTYVCMRNIAMTASSVLLDKIDFGRSSPYALPGATPSINKDVYHHFAKCRHAGTRGTPAPDVPIDVNGALRECLDWAENIERMVK